MTNMSITAATSILQNLRQMITWKADGDGGGRPENNEADETTTIEWQRRAPTAKLKFKFSPQNINIFNQIHSSELLFFLQTN